MVHRNFEQVEEMVNSLKEMDSKLDMLEEMLGMDSRNIIGPAPNLLAIHFHLNQLEAFRNQTTHQAKKASGESRAILARRFERLFEYVKEFEDYYATLCHNVLPLAREGYPSVVVKLIKIAEIEGKEDEKVRNMYITSLLFKELKRTKLGHSDSVSEKSREIGCCLEVPINASQCPNDQALSFQDD